MTGAWPQPRTVGERSRGVRRRSRNLLRALVLVGGALLALVVVLGGALLAVVMAVASTRQGDRQHAGPAKSGPAPARVSRPRRRLALLEHGASAAVLLGLMVM